MNYFKVLNIPVTYAIDEKLLTRNYMKKQMELHPDVSILTDGSDVSYLNIAYKTLLSPILRAEYFLKINNILNINREFKYAEKMFEMSEKYESLISIDEKKDFQNNLKTENAQLIQNLYETEENLQEFKKKFSLILFINSFLKKVETDVYCRN